MRRFLLLGALFLPMVAPSGAFAGTCPALDQGVVDKTSYRLGELIDFYGTYHDFADPGTVTIDFVRPGDGATRSYTAGNSPDGSWYLRLTLHSTADVGRWRVTVVVTQTGALDTCTDSVTIRPRSGVPDTATDELPREPADSRGAATMWFVGLLGALIAVRRFARSPV